MIQKYINDSASAPPLIFTERKLVPRLIDGALTLIAWCGFIWLVYIGLLSNMTYQSMIETKLLGLSINTVTLYILVAALNALILILWAKYNQVRFQRERRSRAQPLALEQLTDHFAITSDTLAQLSHAHTAVVYYNLEGNKLKLEVTRRLTSNAKALKM